MGAVCDDCRTYQEQIPSIINVSKQTFIPVQPNPEKFQQIKTLTNNQLPQNFGSSNFYLKGEDTYFIGIIQQSQQSSFGVLYKPQQTLYYGQFLNGLFQGKGVLKLLKKDMTFRGSFKEGKLFGKGTLQNPSSFMFNGIWKEGNKPISGTLKFYSNQKIKIIQFIDCQSGSVQIIYKNGQFFKGFVDKKTLLPHGMGKIVYLSDDSYDGEWVNGKFQGNGVYTFNDGKIYNGEYLEGLKHGQGTLYLSNNRYFIGEWKKGKREGFGKIMQEGGKILQRGIYRNNKFDHEQTQAYLSNHIEKTVKQQLRSQLRDEQPKDDLSIEDKMYNR